MSAAPTAEKKGVKRRDGEVGADSFRFRGDIPESEVFSQLLDIEERIDRQLKRRKLDVADAMNRLTKAQEMLQITFSGTRMVDPTNPENQHIMISVDAAMPTRTVNAPTSFDEMCTRVVLEVGSLASGTPADQLMTLEWDGAGRVRPSADRPVHTGSLEEERPTRLAWRLPYVAAQFSMPPATLPATTGVDPKRPYMWLRVHIFVNHQPPRFSLSPALRALVPGIEHGSKADIVEAVWTHLKQTQQVDLTGDGDCMIQVASEAFQQLFGGRTEIPVSRLVAEIERHLTPLPPVTMELWYSHSMNAPDFKTLETSIYTTGVSTVEDDPRTEQEIRELNRQIAADIEVITQRRQRRAFLSQFAESPVQVLENFVVQQSRNLQAFQDRERELKRRSLLFVQPWIMDAVSHYAAGERQKRKQQQVQPR